MLGKTMYWRHITCIFQHRCDVLLMAAGSHSYLVQSLELVTSATTDMLRMPFFLSSVRSCLCSALHGTACQVQSGYLSSTHGLINTTRSCEHCSTVE